MTDWKDKRRVKRRYDLTSEMYEGLYAEEQKAKYKAALENLEFAGGVVLDLGCGSGLLFNEVSSQSKMIVGLDISGKLLLKAKDQADKSKKVFVLQADADHLPFKDASFDVIFAFTVLQNLPKPDVTLKELERVNKRGGRIVVTGLKKAFPFSTFVDALEGSGMKVISFIDNRDLKCYVATMTTSV